MIARTVTVTVVVVFLVINLMEYGKCHAKPKTVLPKEILKYVPFYQPYDFAFHSDDGQGTTQHRKESAHLDGSVTGTYGYVDPYGMYRIVEYVADENGFRAVVKTNEPGTTNQNTADAQWVVQPPPSDLRLTSSKQDFSKSNPLPMKVDSRNITTVASPSNKISSALYGPTARSTVLQLSFKTVAKPRRIINPSSYLQTRLRDRPLERFGRTA